MYLLQYGRIPKRSTAPVLVSKRDLQKYYEDYYGNREVTWKAQLGDDLNWHLSFDYLREKDTTKHVHRLHPYKGKFIPQLVKYFLDSHYDNFKKEIYFQRGDIILDPFCGSGTTLVQANEMGLDAVGIDISSFNCFISNLKIKDYDFHRLQERINDITYQFNVLTSSSINRLFDVRLAEYITRFNKEFFPSPNFGIKVRKGEINEKKYTMEKEREFIAIYKELVKQYGIRVMQARGKSFLDRWLLLPIRQEIEILHSMIIKTTEEDIRDILLLILSRTLRSCRATTHADLATLKEPVTQPYYCRKHGKICKPLFSVTTWWKRYTQDTLERLREFSQLRTSTMQTCLIGDARTVDILAAMEKKKHSLFLNIKQKGLRGIFSSPPYIGLIDYHEQHAYAYELFGFSRQDELEIGPKFRGQGKAAREAYVQSIAKVLMNCKRFFVPDYEVFLVANDKYDLYPEIAKKAGMHIRNRYRRPVLNRTEKDKGAYSETVFPFTQ